MVIYISIKYWLDYLKHTVCYHIRRLIYLVTDVFLLPCTKTSSVPLPPPLSQHRLAGIAGLHVSENIASSPSFTAKQKKEEKQKNNYIRKTNNKQHKV